MANILASLSSHYQNSIDDTLKKYTQKPQGIEDSLITQKFMQLATMRDVKEFEQAFVWNSTLKAELDVVVKGLQESNPEKQHRHWMLKKRKF